MLKTAGVPTWVTAFAAILGLYCTAIGIAGLFDPSGVANFVTGADDLAASWSGRMAGTGVALLLAIALRSAAAHVVAFGAAIFREVGDAVAATSDTAEGFPLVVVLLVLLIDVAAFAVVLRSAIAATSGASVER